jgi:hypothetical protein
MPPPPPYSDICDIALKDKLDGSILVLANKEGQDNIESLVPDYPFDWIRDGIDDPPNEWRYATFRPSEVSNLDPPDVIGFSTALLRNGCHLVIKQGNTYKALTNEADIQKLRPQ